MEKKKLIPLILIFALGNLLGCSDNETSFPSMNITEEPETETDLTTGLPSSVDSLSDVATNSALFVKVGIIPETVRVQDAPSEEVKSSLISPTVSAVDFGGTAAKCEIPVNESGVASTDTIYCMYDVPELTLYYSHLKFIVGTNRPGFCNFVSFDPYSYRRSSAVLDENIPASGYLDPNTEEYVTCGGPIKDQSPACFGGAAASMLELLGIDFPGNSGTYFLSSSTARLNFYYLLSENKTRRYGSKKVNLATSNYYMPLVSPGVGHYNDVRDEVVYNDDLNPSYQISCLDVYHETKFTINVVIRSQQGPLDHILRWNQAVTP